MSANSTSFTSETGAEAGRIATAFKPEFVEQARKLAAAGWIEVEIADFFQVTDRTLRRWKLAHPDFAAALAVGKEGPDERVKASLYHRAIGYSHSAVKMHVINGVVEQTEFTEHYPPDTAAAIFWLKNRCGWRDKVDHEHTGKDGAAIEHKATVEAVMSMLPQVRDEC